MNASQRVTPERVEKAYAKCGFRPMRGEFYKKGACCALTAVAIVENGETDERRLAESYDDDRVTSIAIDGLKLGDAYAMGFISAWDAPAWDDEAPSTRGDEFAAGATDGRAALIHMGLHKPANRPRPGGSPAGGRCQLANARPLA